MNFLYAFLVGGAICTVCQILIDLTALTPARILVGLAVFGVFLSAVGIYEPLFEISGCGVSLPLLGYGANIAKGVREAVSEYGLLGIFKGPFTAGSVGCSAALFFGFLFALFFKGKPKSTEF